MLALMGCADDATSAEVTLTVELVTAGNSLVQGGGISCGTIAPCDANGQGAAATSCEITVPRGTSLRLDVIHPVCGSGGTYFAFGFAPATACATTESTGCELVLATDVALTVTGISALE